MSPYLFDNADGHTPERFSVLESRYDPGSRKALEAVGVRPGWRCLEVGGGGGSLGDWLGEKVGPGGEVTVTDIEPKWAADHQHPQNVRLLVHDITRDPLPGSTYDLVHARLVLIHLPERRAVLERLVRALKPGGWLVLEEFDCRWMPVFAAPDEESAALFGRVHGALLELLEKAGADPLWGRRVVGTMMRAGLEEVTATTYAETWRGGGEGIQLHGLNIAQAAGGMGELGIGGEELERFLELLEDPEFVVNSYPMVSARGRRAGAP